MHVVVADIPGYSSNYSRTIL